MPGYRIKSPFQKISDREMDVIKMLQYYNFNFCMGYGTQVTVETYWPLVCWDNVKQIVLIYEWTLKFANIGFHADDTWSWLLRICKHFRIKLSELLWRHVLWGTDRWLSTHRCVFNWSALTYLRSKNVLIYHWIVWSDLIVCRLNMRLWRDYVIRRDKKKNDLLTFLYFQVEYMQPWINRIVQTRCSCGNCAYS